MADAVTTRTIYSGGMEKVRIINGVTYTLIARHRPAEGQNAVRWVGDNGDEIELTAEEVNELY